MFRFTIRDVLWLMMVVVVVAAWYADRTHCMSVIRHLNIEEGKGVRNEWHCRL